MAGIYECRHLTSPIETNANDSPMQDLLTPDTGSPPSAEPSEHSARESSSAQKIFVRWSGAGAAKTRKSLNPRSIQNYRSTWMNWVEWLPPDTPWEKATSRHVTDYLQQLTASARARMKAVNLPPRPASPVTRHRYWRVLRDIYSYAVILKECPENPCDEASEVPRNEVMASMVLQPWALKQMQGAILQEHAKRPFSTWQQLRDDALLLLLLETGAKTGELISMRADQMWRVHSGRLSEQWGIKFDGERDPQKRHFTIAEPQVCAVLAKWWQARQELPGTPPSLFFGAKSKGEGSARLRTPLTPKSVFLLVANMVSTHLPPNAFHGPLSHVGAETIRNSVLHRWLLEKVPPEVVRNRAGVAELRAVERLIR